MREHRESGSNIWRARRPRVMRGTRPDFVDEYIAFVVRTAMSDRIVHGEEQIGLNGISMEIYDAGNSTHRSI